MPRDQDWIKFPKQKILPFGGVQQLTEWMYMLVFQVQFRSNWKSSCMVKSQHWKYRLFRSSEHICWQKIHENIVMDLCQVFDLELDSLDIQNSPEREYSSKEIIQNELFMCWCYFSWQNYNWQISRPSLLHHNKDVYDGTTSTKFWVDVQLKWGDYDSHDIGEILKIKIFRLHNWQYEYLSMPHWCSFGCWLGL